MIEIGKYNVLEVLRDTSSGLFLGGDEEDDQDVLLPGNAIPEGTSVGDKLEVFIYNDSEDRVIATTLQPKITLHHFAYLQVKMVTKMGAFMDWGLNKDLLVPFREQNGAMQEDKYYIVYLYLDKATNRLVGSSKISRFLYNQALTIEEGEEVDLLFWQNTELGINVIINHVHKGLLYHNELFEKVKIGDVRKGYIKKIREDNKIDVSLQKLGYENVEPNAQKILNKLKEMKGFLPLSDNSSPAEITQQLEMSKKTFKKSIGLLYKQKMIRLEENGIYLNE
jgi:uncharacterized protein